MSPTGRMDLSIYLVTDAAQCRAAGRTVHDTVAAAVSGGVTCVQVRQKTGSGRDFLDTVLRVAERVGDRATVLVNDRVDVYLAARQSDSRVHGVHIGQDDLPAEAVRTLIGPAAVLGLSAATPDELAQAADSSASVDYVGIGALHSTATKGDAPQTLGIDGFADRARHTPLPAVAIGGMTRADMAPLRAAGAAGGAVVSAICSAQDPRRAAEDLARAWNATAGPTTADCRDQTRGETR